MPRRSHAFLQAVVAASFLAGCAVGPDYRAPRLEPGAGYGSAEPPARTTAAEAPDGRAQRFAVGADIPAEWWELFHSPALDELVRQSLARNPDLAAARAGLRIAMENLASARGAYLPAIGAGGNLGRNQGANPPAPFLASNVLLYNLYQAQLQATWSLDLWGQNRRTVEALKAEAESQRFQLESSYLALTANVVSAAIEEASLRAQLEATQDMVAAGARTLAIFRREYALGEIAGMDFADAEAAQAVLDQGPPPLRRQLAQERDLLTAMAGRLPSDEVAETFDLPGLDLPQEIPVSLPSRLVEQRPDIRVAEANLHAACAEVGVAVSNLLPNLEITADAGAIATRGAGLFAPGNYFWSAGAGVTQPLFQGGSLWHRSKAAQAEYRQAADEYRSAVLTAFQNVADSLHALQNDADLLRAAASAERAARDAFDISRKQLELGGASALPVLSAEQAWDQAKIALVQAQAERLSDTAALFQALGGGWWNRRAALQPQ